MLDLAGRMICRRVKMKYYLHEKNVHDNNTKSTNHYTPVIEHSNGIPPLEDVFPIQDGDFPLLCLFTGG